MTYRRGFVAMDTIDEMIERVKGIVGTDRRISKTRRYIYQGKESPGSVEIKAGLTISTDAYKPIEEWDGNGGKGIHFHLGPGFEGFGISAYENESPTAKAAQERYYKSDGSVFNRRENITVLATQGWPGEREHRRDDMIWIEDWNSNGVGIETVIAFDDVRPVHLIGDPLVGHYFEKSWCTTHDQHYEEPGHEYVFDRPARPGCKHREATLAENLRMLATLTEKKEETNA